MTAAGYSGTPLAQKLGIKAGSTVLLDGAPAGFDLADAPPDATVLRRAGSGPYDVIVCFCTQLDRLRRRWPALHSRTTAAGGLWVAWPKRASGVATDLSDNVVRDFVLSTGRVDVKICAVDEVWSAMKNVVRLVDR
jgi:hypothetical protein